MKEERNNTSTCSPCPLVLRMQNNFIFHKKIYFLLQLSFFTPSSGLFSSLTSFDYGPFPIVHYLFNKEYFISGKNSDVSLSECFIRHCCRHLHTLSLNSTTTLPWSIEVIFSLHGVAIWSPGSFVSQYRRSIAGQNLGLRGSRNYAISTMVSLYSVRFQQVGFW